MKYIGIDYSLTHPCLTILNDSSFSQGESFFLTDTKKYTNKFGNITGELHKQYVNNIQRYENIALWVLNLLQKDDIICIEDYSLGSQGKVFNIAEATGILKYSLYKNGYKYTQIPPTTIKKFATDRGNATKDKMYEFFLKDTCVDLQNILQCYSIKSPLTDVVDSYYKAKWGIANVSTV